MVLLQVLQGFILLYYFPTKVFTNLSINPIIKIYNPILLPPNGVTVSNQRLTNPSQKGSTSRTICATPASRQKPSSCNADRVNKSQYHPNHSSTEWLASLLARIKVTIHTDIHHTHTIYEMVCVWRSSHRLVGSKMRSAPFSLSLPQTLSIYWGFAWCLVDCAGRVLMQVLNTIYLRCIWRLCGLSIEGVGEHL